MFREQIIKRVKTEGKKITDFKQAINSYGNITNIWFLDLDAVTINYNFLVDLNNIASNNGYELGEVDYSDRITIWFYPLF